MGRYTNMPKRGPDHSEPIYDRRVVTIDWDKIRCDYQARLQRDIEAGVDNQETRAELARRRGEVVPNKSRPVSGPSRRGENLKNRRPHPLREAMVNLYTGDEKLRTGEIAERLNVKVDLVRYQLKAAGVFDPHRDRGGTRRQETCKRGHSLADGYERADGGRDCRHCPKER